MFHYTRAVLTSGPQFISSFIGWLNKYSKHPEKYPFSLRYHRLRKMIKTISRGLKIQFFVLGKENLPTDEVFCVLSNHLSAYDPLAFIAVLDAPTTFVAKKEVIKMPVVGKCVKSINGEFIDRKDIKQSLRVMLNVEEDLKQQNKNWIIFPEGTRNHDPFSTVSDFHHGTFRPAMKAGVPIVPAAIYGTFRCLKFSPQFKTYPVYISFLKPIYKEDYSSLSTNEVANMVQRRIQREITYNLRPLDHQKMIESKDKTPYQKIV